MKRMLLSVVILSMITLGYAQKRVPLPKEKANIVKTATVQVPLSGEEVIQMPVSTDIPVPSNSKTDLIPGYTDYDLQSNTLLGNRMWVFDDGTANAVWTFGPAGTGQAFPGRGTGYNYFDGTAWGQPPTERVEDGYRCGWPSVAAWGENGEIIVSHIADPNFQPGGLIINKRENKGTGDWTQIYLEGPADMGGTDITWPRVTTSGDNHDLIHLIVPAASETNGQDVPLLYTNSEDGENWSDWTILDEIGPDYYTGFSADDYTWAESRGDVIAFTISSPWHDWIVMKSDDAGESWEKIIIWEHPYPFFDWNSTITTDTIWAPDNSADIAIDNDGMIHAVCGLTRVLHNEVGTTYTYFPYTDGIIYWNETMPPFTNSNQHYALKYENLVENQTLIGWTQDVNGDGEITFLDELQSYRELGISTMPNITVSSVDNQVFVAWASTTETYENGTKNFKHIWLRRSKDGGTTWDEDFHDIDSDISHWLDECIYPVLAGDVDPGSGAEGKLHLIYQADATPGTALDGDHDYHQNIIYHFSADIDTYFITGIDENNIITDASVGQNNPNPFSSISKIAVNLAEKANLSIEVTNMMGQVVYTENQGTVNAGHAEFVLNAVNFKPGVYFYTVKANDSKVTKKMIVE